MLQNEIDLSIIIPCYNDYKYVLEAVDTAVNQTYGNKEVIIVNDGSNIETEAVLNSINNPIVSIINQKNKGLSGARNTGILNAKGKYIMLLDSDDKFEKTFAERAISILEKNSKTAVVTCWGKRFVDNNILNEFKPLGGEINNFLFSNSAIGTSMLRRNVWEEVGGYDENMKKGYEDWEFYIRVSSLYKVFVIKDFLFFYRQKKDSMLINAKNNHDLEIKKYIYNKHKNIYINNYNKLIDFFLEEAEKHKKEIIKQQNKLEFRIGYSILKPIRFIKSIFSVK